jgi:hypothetical protein
MHHQILKATFPLLFFFSCIILSYGQQIQLKGYVKDKEGNFPLAGAFISIPELKTGVTTDTNGYFTIFLPKDSIHIITEYAGYVPDDRKIYLNKTTKLNIELSSEFSSLEEVIIEGNTSENKLKEAQMSVVSVDSKEAKVIPVFFGEIDLMKILQLKPGVQSGNEGSSGLYVRGGGPDQNLIMMDNAIVYNASHLLGFFSLFNPDAVKSVDLYKGDFPAQFGGRLSSVVDIKLNEGSKEKFGLKGGIGLLSSRLSLEGPLKKNKSSFIVAVRRTYMDLYTPSINRLNKNKTDYDPIPGYYFYDVNAKLSFELGKKDHLTVSGYFGKDVLDLSTRNFNSLIRWGNAIGAARWNHTFSNKLYSNTSLNFSEYNYTIVYRFNVFSNNLRTRISDYSIKSDFQYYPDSIHTVKFGGAITFHNFNIGRIKTSNDGEISFGEGNKLDATESAIYLSDEFDLTPKIRINAGIRFTAFVNDSSFFGGPEPRMTARYLVNEKISLKASFSRMFQYIHLASNSGASLPNDIWFPSNSAIKPQRSDQAAAGMNISLFKDQLMFTNEVYYKWMKRQVDIREGAAIFDLPDLNEGFTVGKGWSYGNEVYLEKKKGKTTGWIGYTLSWTWRKFPEINGGEKFPARYDRRHNISFVVIHKLSPRLLLSAAWVFATGNAITLPVRNIALQDINYAQRGYVPQYMPRNSFRMPDSHRLDLGLVWKLRPKHGESDLTFSIYNAYSRRNAYFIYFEPVPDSSGDPSRKELVKFRAKQVSLFPLIPSISYNFKF